MLAEEVKKQKSAHPAPPMSQVRAEVIRNAITAEHQLEVTLPGKGKYVTIPDYIAVRVNNFNAKQYLIAVVQCCWETLERFRKTEEELAYRGLPVQHLADACAKITDNMIDALAELRQHENDGGTC